MKDLAKLTYTPDAGDEIRRSAEKMVQLARAHAPCEVHSVWNDVPVVAVNDDLQQTTVTQLLAKYMGDRMPARVETASNGFLVCNACRDRRVGILAVAIKGTHPCAVCGTTRKVYKVEQLPLRKPSPGDTTLPRATAEAQLPAKPASSKAARLWEIESHLCIGNRFATYLRTLQNLAMEVDRLLPLIDEMAEETSTEDGRGLQRRYVSTELRKHLERITAAAELDGPKNEDQ